MNRSSRRESLTSVVSDSAVEVGLGAWDILDTPWKNHLERQKMEIWKMNVLFNWVSFWGSMLTFKGVHVGKMGWKIAIFKRKMHLYKDPLLCWSARGNIRCWFHRLWISTIFTHCLRWVQFDLLSTGLKPPPRKHQSCVSLMFIYIYIIYIFRQWKKWCHDSKKEHQQVHYIVMWSKAK